MGKRKLPCWSPTTNSMRPQKVFPFVLHCVEKEVSLCISHLEPYAKYLEWRDSFGVFGELKPAPNQFYAFPVEKHRDVGLSLGHPLCSSTTTRATCWPMLAPFSIWLDGSRPSGCYPALRNHLRSSSALECISLTWETRSQGVKIGVHGANCYCSWGSNTPIHSNCGHRVPWSLPLSWI